MNKGSTVVIRPARNVSGSLRLPGDKSISHRYAMLAGIAEGKTRLENYSTGADCASTLACLKTLGVDWKRNGNTVVIDGRGARLHAPSAPLDCGNSGSTMRMLSGILAGQDFSSELTGDESLSRRPMARIITPLEAMAAGLPVVATNTGGSREIFRDQDNSLIFLPDDAAGCANAIIALQTDPSLYQRIRDRARSLVVSTYTIERMADRIEQDLTEAIGR